MNREVYSRTEKTKDRWETPPYFFELLEDYLHRSFTLDPCASHQNHLCDKYYTIKENGLKQDWKNETVFVNPPYSHIKEWCQKCYEEGRKNNTRVVMLIPSRTDTRFWHSWVMGAWRILLCKGRIKFLLDGKELDCAPFPSAIILFENHENIDPLLEPFEHLPFKKIYENRKNNRRLIND